MTRARHTKASMYIVFVHIIDYEGPASVIINALVFRLDISALFDDLYGQRQSDRLDASDIAKIIDLCSSHRVLN